MNDLEKLKENLEKLFNRKFEIHYTDITTIASVYNENDFCILAQSNDPEADQNAPSLSDCCISILNNEYTFLHSFKLY